MSRGRSRRGEDIKRDERGGRNRKNGASCSGVTSSLGRVVPLRHRHHRNTGRKPVIISNSEIIDCDLGGGGAIVGG